MDILEIASFKCAHFEVAVLPAAKLLPRQKGGLWIMAVCQIPHGVVYNGKARCFSVTTIGVALSCGVEGPCSAGHCCSCARHLSAVASSAHIDASKSPLLHLITSYNIDVSDGLRNLQVLTVTWQQQQQQLRLCVAPVLAKLHNTINCR
jgi:hypothetical protein